MRCLQLRALAESPLWSCGAPSLLVWAWPLVYYGFCGGCGAAAGAVLAFAFKQRGAWPRLALAGFLSFSLGALAGNRWLQPIFHDDSLDFLFAVASLAIQVVPIAPLASLLAGGAIRDWRLLLRFTTTGALAFGGGCVLGFLVAELLWGLAQAVASYQPAPVYAWVMQIAPPILVGVICAVTGATWGTALARGMARRHSAT